MNPTRRAFLPAVLLTLPLSPLFAQDGPSIGTKLPAKKGDAAAFVVHATQQQVIDAAGRQIEMASETKHDVVLRVTDVDEAGTLTLDLHVQRIRGSFENPMMGTIEFDTKSPAEDDDGNSDMGGPGMPDAATLTAIMRPLTAKSLIAKVSSTGTVQSIQGLDEVLAQAKAAGPASKMLAGAISEDAIRSLLHGLLGHVPPEPTAVGGSWEQAETEKRQAPMKRLVKVTVLEAGEATYKVGTAGTVTSLSDEEIAKLDEPKDAGENDPMADAREVLKSMKIKSGKITGTATVDRSTGFVVDRDSKTTMDMTFDMMGGEATLAVTSTTKITRRPETGDEHAAKEPAKAKDADAKQPTPDKAK